MRIPFPSSVIPDHDNYSFLGKAWKDRFNGVTELSAQIGSGGPNLWDNGERHAHQTKLLEARLNTFLDAASTPAVVTKTAIGRVEVPYVKSPLPALRDARILPSFSRARADSMESFNKRKAISKLKEEFLRCDEPVRTAFLEKIRGDIDSAQAGSFIRAKLDESYAELSRLTSKKKFQDLDSLEQKRSQLELRKTEVGEMRGKEKLYGQAALLFNGTDRKLRSIDRKTKEILRPSSYELHRANNNGDKVTNRPLYVEKLKNLRREGINSAQYLKTETGIRNFTETQFDKLADAIRDFCDQVNTRDGTSATDEQALRAAAKPILYSREREAVHRFIRDMVRQLKKAGVPAEHLSEIRALIPDKPSGAQALFQGLVPGTGKQMRLQDEAERMAKALPKVLRLTAAYGEKLQENLMQFDLSGVQAFERYLNTTQANNLDAVEFIKTAQGKAFVDAIVEKGIELLGQDHHVIKDLKPRWLKQDPETTLFYTKNLLRQILQKEDPTCSSFDDLVQKNRHLFMVTSDEEFWEREAVGKAATRLTNEPGANSTKKSRIFKQMKLRAAAMGMDPDQVDAYMIQGIANTLRNRNMVIEGTKIAGVIGSVAGNISSTPLSVVAAPHAPFLALPGIMDLALMPAGWAIGQIPGAIFGATVLNDMKRARLQEAEHNMDVVRSNLYGASDTNDTRVTYTSAGKSVRFSRKKLATPVNVEKPVLTPMARGSFSQYKHAHGQVWKGMAKEISSLVWTPIRYVFSTGPKDAWKDLVIHNDPALVKRRATKLKATVTYESTPFQLGPTTGSRSKVSPPPNWAMVKGVPPGAERSYWNDAGEPDTEWARSLYATY